MRTESTGSWSSTTRESVFKDVHSIQPGLDFRRAIKTAVGRCDVLLAVVGPNWASVTDEHGRRRIDSPGDFVRLEVETALERQIPVIPLRDDNAPMPPEGELPESLQPLVFRNAMPLRPDPDFDVDMARLLETLEGMEKRSGGWMPIVLRRPANRSLVRPWIVATAVLTCALVFSLLMVLVRIAPIAPFTGPAPPNGGAAVPKREPLTPTPDRPKEKNVVTQKDPPHKDPDPPQPNVVAQLTSAEELKKVEEQIECADYTKARELLRQFKSRYVGDPVLSYYDAVAAALAARKWVGEPESLMQSGLELEKKGGLTSNRERMDGSLKCLLPYLSQADNAKFQQLLGRSIVSRSPARSELTPPSTVLIPNVPEIVAQLTSADELKKVEEQIECGDHAKAREMLRELKSRCAGDPVLSFYDAVAAALAAGNWSGEPERLISRGRKLETAGPASSRDRLDAMLKCLLPYLKLEDKARFQQLLGRSLE